MKRAHISALFLPAIVALCLSLSAAAGTAEKFGKALSNADKTALSDILKNPDAYSGKTVKTEGKVAAVCQEKGCWMTFNEGGQSIRIRFKDYAFFVPKDCGGATAVVEGVFAVKTIPEATAKHYAGETPGGKPDAIKGDQKELSFEAAGVELIRAK